MPSTYNRVRVEDLLNDVPQSSSSRKHSMASKTNILDIECEFPNCIRKFASHESRLAHQRRSHPPPTNYVCDYCKSSFSTSPNLNKHVRSVHKRMRPFKCDKCDFSFGFRDGLQRHKEMVHDQLRPFTCNFCGKNFKTKSHMEKHALAIHPEMYMHELGRHQK